MKAEAKKELIKKAMDHVWPTEEEFIRNFAYESTVANLGSSLEDARGLSEGTKPEYVPGIAYSQVADEHGYEGVDVEPEFKSWLKDGKKVAATLKKHGMALTLTNAQEVTNNPKKYAKAPPKSKK